MHMKISKKVIEDIINRLYIIEQNGEKVIRPDRVDELTGIISGRYENGGCNIEKVVGGEKLVVYATNKSGVKKIFECKIGVDNSKASGKISGVTYVGLKWHVKEISRILQSIGKQYGKEIYKDKKRFAAILADKVFEYPEEGKILKMVFNEGIYTVIETCANLEERFVKPRILSFLDNLGLELEVKQKIVEIMIASFLTKDVNEATVTNIGATSKEGQIYFVAKENDAHPEWRMFRLAIESETGLGLFKRDSLKKYVEALNATADAYRYLAEKSKIPKISENLSKKNCSMYCECCEKKVLTSSLSLATMISLASSALDVKPVEGIVVLGDADSEGNVVKCSDIVACMRKSVEYHANGVLLPVGNAADIGKVPTELLTVSMLFYSTVDEAIKKALNIKE